MNFKNMRILFSPRDSGGGAGGGTNANAFCVAVNASFIRGCTPASQETGVVDTLEGLLVALFKTERCNIVIEYNKTILY
jgi:hypothetical protein